MAYPLLGTRFILDEEKILREDKYDLDKMYEIIEEMANKCGLIKIDKNTYHCKGDREDLGRLGVFAFHNLVECDWFTLNVKEWEWLSEKERNSDMISFCKENNEGVWA
ncbi:hypothetical protein [Campylobacter cuniculorum]|uniref:hypothetical protein n=1 Tax=Campylobacter cuniculorum TaxID=374106 RepID=UPI0023F3CCDF|nr:hypothetical protein [Campylobacter cuniculorum]